MSTYPGEARELTRPERAAIRKLIIDMCANYDWEYGCLSMENPCYMMGKFWTGGMCTYFRTAVLPLDPFLEASMLGREAPTSDVCAACGKSFFPQGRQMYCTAACQTEGNRRRSRERMRKRRRDK